MKKICLIFLLLTVISFLGKVYSQNIPIDTDTKLITYREVVQQQGTKDELYPRVIDWVNSFYKNPADACRVRNPENAIVETSHRIEIFFPEMDGIKKLAGYVNYSVKIECKENKYRYTVTDFTLKQASKFPIERWLDKNDKAYNANCDFFLKQVDDYTQNLIKTLKEKMQPTVKKEDNW
jgi:hypothetical protein